MAHAASGMPPHTTGSQLRLGSLLAVVQRFTRSYYTVPTRWLATPRHLATRRLGCTPGLGFAVFRAAIGRAVTVGEGGEEVGMGEMQMRERAGEWESIAGDAGRGPASGDREIAGEIGILGGRRVGVSALSESCKHSGTSWRGVRRCRSACPLALPRVWRGACEAAPLRLPRAQPALALCRVTIVTIVRVTSGWQLLRTGYFRMAVSFSCKID